VFEYFLEKNMIAFFDQIMVQDAAAGVNTQLLQVGHVTSPMVLGVRVGLHVRAGGRAVGYATPRARASHMISVEDGGMEG